MTKNSISYGLLGGLIGGLGFLGYKIFNGEDADEETIENAKKSVSFNIDGTQQENNNVIETVITEQDTSTDTNANGDSNKMEETAKIEDTENIDKKIEKIESIDTNDTVDLELEAQEVDIDTETEPVVKNIFKRQDSTIDSSTLDSSNVGRIVAV